MLTKNEQNLLILIFFIVVYFTWKMNNIEKKNIEKENLEKENLEKENIETFNNASIDPVVANAIQKVYAADLDAVTKLSNFAIQLSNGGVITVPGSATFTGTVTTGELKPSSITTSGSGSITTSGNITATATTTGNGTITGRTITATGNISTNTGNISTTTGTITGKTITATDDITGVTIKTTGQNNYFGTNNKWDIHTPLNNSTSIYFAPVTGTTTIWNNQLEYNGSNKTLTVGGPNGTGTVKCTEITATGAVSTGALKPSSITTSGAVSTGALTTSSIKSTGELTVENNNLTVQGLFNTTTNTWIGGLITSRFINILNDLTIGMGSNSWAFIPGSNSKLSLWPKKSNNSDWDKTINSIEIDGLTGTIKSNGLNVKNTTGVNVVTINNTGALTASSITTTGAITATGALTASTITTTGAVSTGALTASNITTTGDNYLNGENINMGSTNKWVIHTPNNNTSIFIAPKDTNGNPIWTKQLQYNGSDKILTVGGLTAIGIITGDTINSNGNITATGTGKVTCKEIECATSFKINGIPNCGVYLINTFNSSGQYYSVPLLTSIPTYASMIYTTTTAITNPQKADGTIGGSASVFSINYTDKDNGYIVYPGYGIIVYNTTATVTTTSISWPTTIILNYKNNTKNPVSVSAPGNVQKGKSCRIYYNNAEIPYVL
jgi:hypothetical protein